MATARYKFKGVPKTFTSKAAALRFLRNSPGYVERQGDYLHTYWPGVMAELEKSQPKKKSFLHGLIDTNLPGSHFSTGDYLHYINRGAGIVAGQKGGAVQAIEGGIAKTVRDTLGAAQTGGSYKAPRSPLPSGVQKAASVAAPTSNRIVKTTSGLADATLGKGIPNLVQGQGPKNWMDVAGLGIGAAAILPVGRGGKLLGSSIKEGLKARDAVEVAAEAARVSNKPRRAAKAAVESTIAGDVGTEAGRAGATRAARAGRAGADRGGVGGVRAGSGAEASGAAAGAGAAPKLVARAVPRTPEAVDARIDVLEKRLDNHVGFIAKGLREMGAGKGERRSLVAGPKEASSFGEREQMIINEWKAQQEAARRGNKIRGRRYGSWEEMAIEKYGAHTDARGNYKGFDESNVNPKKVVQTDKPLEWYRDQAQHDLRAMMVQDAAKGDRRAQAILRSIDELESLKSLRAKNAGADLFPEDVPVGGYGFDLRVERVAPEAGSAVPPPRPPVPPTSVGPAAPMPPSGGMVGPKTLKETVKEAFSGVDEAIAAKNAVNSQERAIRAKSAMQAYHDAGGGSAGIKAATGELKGAFPQVDWNGFTELSPETVDHMIRSVDNNPEFGFYDLLHISEGLDRAVSGRNVQQHQLNVIRRAFGDDVAKSLTRPENKSFWARLYNAGVHIWNIPRAIMASFDLSAPFRQGLVAGTKHPIIFARNFKPMVKSFGSERVTRAIAEEIPTRPNFQRYGIAELKFSDMAGMREEQWPGSYVDNLPGIKSSARAYSTFLNKMRADVFDHVIDVAEKHGKNVDDPTFLKALGEHVMNATGRGKIPGGDAGEAAASFLNQFLFSPRLLASRFQILNPVYYAKLAKTDPFVARQAAYSLATTLGGIGTMVYLASNIPGAKVGSSSLSADFGKVRIGDTRLDFAGGFQPLIVLYSRFAKKKSVSSSTGKSQDINGDYGTQSRGDLIVRFMESKMAPSPRLVWDIFNERNYVGEPVTPKSVAQGLLPLNFQGAQDVYRTEGSLPAAFGGAVLGSVGFGVNSYPDKPVSTSTASRSGGGKPGGSSRSVSNKPSRRSASVSNKP